MKRFVLKTIATSVILASAQAACAGTDVFFNPLTQSTAVATAGHVNELNSPWQVPAGITQINLTSLREIEADVSQSVIRVPGLGSGAAMFDMVSFDPTGKYVFIPHETQYGAGLTRYNIEADAATVLVRGDAIGRTGNWSADYGAFDPSTWTPINTLLLGEEWSGQGRLFEVMNPMAAPADISMRELNSVPNVSHEGLRFNQDGSAFYFVDEDNSGSIYKFIPTTKGDYTRGQSFVLVVDAFAGDASLTYNAGVNATAVRTGLATWVPITDVNGNKLTVADPFNNETRGGRAAANEVNGAPYGRPEDIEVGRLNNGNEVVYFAATSELALYSVEEKGNGKALVRLMASETTTPKNLGYAPTTGKVDSPDNIAQDALGNLYIVEDSPNSGGVGGDVWFVRDVDGDGVAESLDHFMSLQVKGSEATGMIFNPANPTQFIVAVQHPETTGIVNGMGDALWAFDLSGVVPPPCVDDKDAHGHRFFGGMRAVKTCSNSNDSNFVEKLKKAGKQDRR